MLHVDGLLGKAVRPISGVAAVLRLPLRSRIPGETSAEATAAAAEIARAGMAVSLVHLPGLDDPEQVFEAYLSALRDLDSANLAEGSDLLVDLVDLGLADQSGATGTRAILGRLCTAAEDVGATVTLGGLAPDRLSVGLAMHADLLADHPDLGVTICADLLRAEADCADLAVADARVRLVRRGTGRSTGLAFTGRHAVDKSFVRCMRLLMAGGGRPVLQTYDQRMIEIAHALAVRYDRDTSDYWFQLRYGVRPEVAAPLVAQGAHVYILVPFGRDWTAYVARHVELRPDAINRPARSALLRRAS